MANPKFFRMRDKMCNNNVEMMVFLVFAEINRWRDSLVKWLQIRSWSTIKTVTIMRVLFLYFLAFPKNVIILFEFCLVMEFFKIELKDSFGW